MVHPTWDGIATAAVAAAEELPILSVYTSVDSTPASAFTSCIPNPFVGLPTSQRHDGFISCSLRSSARTQPHRQCVYVYIPDEIFIRDCDSVVATWVG